MRQDLAVIGTTRASGTIPELHAADDPLVPSAATEDVVPAPPAHTLDALLDTAGPLHLTVLNRLPANRLATITAIGMQTVVLDVDPRAFDAVVHIREIHPLPGVVATMQASIEQATRA